MVFFQANEYPTESESHYH